MLVPVKAKWLRMTWTNRSHQSNMNTQYNHNKTNHNKKMYSISPKKYAHGFCFAVLFCGYTWTDFPISIRLTSLALWQSNDCPSASKATLMNMDKNFMWIHYERLHNHNKQSTTKPCAYFLGYTVCHFRGCNVRVSHRCPLMPANQSSSPNEYLIISYVQIRDHP